MNLAVCGLAADGGQEAADTFARDQHPDQKVDTPLQRVRLGRGEIRRGPPLGVRPATCWQRQHAWLSVVPASDKTRHGVIDGARPCSWMPAKRGGRQAVESPYGNVPGFC